MNTESQFLFGFFLPNAEFMPKNIDKRIDFVELLKDFSTAYLLSNRIVDEADDRGSSSGCVLGARSVLKDLETEIFGTIVQCIFCLYADEKHRERGIDDAIRVLMDQRRRIKNYVSALSKILDPEKFYLREGELQNAEASLSRVYNYWFEKFYGRDAMGHFGRWNPKLGRVNREEEFNYYF